MTDTRPLWPFKTTMKVAEWLISHRVDKITFHMWHDGYGEDSREWMHFYEGKSKSPAITEDMIDDNEINLGFTCWGLAEMCEDIRKRFEAIKEFDKKNSQERAEFERLKRKFGEAQ